MLQGHTFSQDISGCVAWWEIELTKWILNSSLLSSLLPWVMTQLASDIPEECAFGELTRSWATGWVTSLHQPAPRYLLGQTWVQPSFWTQAPIGLTILGTHPHNKQTCIVSNKCLITLTQHKNVFERQSCAKSCAKKINWSFWGDCSCLLPETGSTSSVYPDWQYWWPPNFVLCVTFPYHQHALLVITHYSCALHKVAWFCTVLLS